MRNVQETIIKRNNNLFNLKLGELFQYRQLIYSLAWRDLKVKYAQTFIGFLWALLNPLATLMVFVFVFDKVAQVDTGDTPYYIFAIIGITAWSYFSTLFSEAGNSIIASQDMIKKIYFPKLAIPLSKALSGLVEFAISLLLLFVLMIYSGVSVGAYIWTLPLFILLGLLAGITGGIWISALSVRYRDVKFITPFITKLGLYITPIAYPIAMVPISYQSIVYANPMAGVVEGFRWSIIGTEPPSSALWLSIACIFVLFVLGIVYFKFIERTMADIL